MITRESGSGDSNTRNAKFFHNLTIWEQGKINIKPKPREVRAVETLIQKIVLTLEVILRIFMKLK